MQAIIEVFRMEGVSTSTRIKIIKQLGKSINNQMGMNCTEGLVYELVLALDPEEENRQLRRCLEQFLFLEDGMDESTRPEVVAAALDALGK